MFQIKTVVDFNKTLLQRVINGTAHVISLIDYKSLPVNLKSRYEPIFNRGDTTYRIKPEYIKERADVDPNTVVNHIVTPRAIVANKQVDEDYEKTKYLNAVNKDISRPNTEVSHKTYNDLAMEARMLKKNPVSVKTKYSRY